MKFGLIAHVIQGALNIFSSLGESLLAECIYAVVAILIIFVYTFNAVDPAGYKKFLTHLNLTEVQTADDKAENIYSEMKINQLMLFYYRCINDKNEFIKFAETMDKKIYKKHLD
jgi:hypothetical protein